MRVEWAADLHSWRGHLLMGGARGTAVHAASFPRTRRIVLDKALRTDAGERARVLLHELAHFAWVRLSNADRNAWCALLEAERTRGARGELGWSAEQYKGRELRGRRWREYACESFCDTLAWLYAGLDDHAEFTLAQRFRTVRRAWFLRLIDARDGALRI